MAEQAKFKNITRLFLLVSLPDLTNALRGIHRGLSERPYARSYQGVAICCEAETDAAEWRFWQDHFLKP